MELWTSHHAAPTRAADFARQAEALGWHGITTVDSQNLSGDPYVFLALGATATRTLGLQTSVTNPVTRHAAVTATSALTVQKLSGGRMILGIGRGDSALAHLGRAPARLKWFENYLISLQAYLRGEEVPFAAADIADEAAPPVENLGLADAPSSSRIGWVKDTAKVPVEVAATGARVIRIAARHADRIMFALGAVPERLAWGIETARQAAAEAGRDLETLSFGAYINLACHEDLEVARKLVRVGTGLFARFSVMHGAIAGPASDSQVEVFRNLHATYDMNAHGHQGGQQNAALTDEFMDGYAVIGDADHCLRRLETVQALDINKIAVTGPNFAARAPEAQESAARFTDLVMPRLG